MDRRTLLASAGGSIAALSGCLVFTEDREDLPTEQPPRDGTPDPTPVEDGTPTPSARPADVTVESVIQQVGYVSPTTPDSIGVTGLGTRYLVVEVATERGRLARDDFALAVGSAGREPTTPDRFYRTTWGDDAWYEGGRQRGLIAFAVPEDLGSGAPRLRWPGESTAVPKDVVRRLTTTMPDMTAELAVPDAGDGSREKTVEVAVTNGGDVAGRYLGALNRAGPDVASTPVARVSGVVGAGESRTFEVADEWVAATTDDGESETSVTYRLDDAGDGDSLELTPGG